MQVFIKIQKSILFGAPKITSWTHLQRHVASILFFQEKLQWISLQKFLYNYSYLLLLKSHLRAPKIIPEGPPCHQFYFSISVLLCIILSMFNSQLLLEKNTDRPKYCENFSLLWPSKEFPLGTPNLLDLIITRGSHKYHPSKVSLKLALMYGKKPGYTKNVKSSPFRSVVAHKHGC